LIAAQTLERSRSKRAKITVSPKYYLVCHAIELILKSFILVSGGAEKELFDIGHDLLKAWDRANELGFEAKDKRTETLVQMLAPYHLDHRFRYRKTGFMTIPETKEMCKITDNLIKQIGPIVDGAMRAEIRAQRSPQERA